MDFIYYSNVKEGKMQRNVALQIANDVKHFEGKRIEIKICKLKSTRSLQQNRLWWVYMTFLSKDLGYSKDEIHEICKFKFLQREKVIESTGEIMPYLESTTKLSKTDFASMVNELIRWSAETFNIILPLPGEQLEIE